MWPIYASWPTKGSQHCSAHKHRGSLSLQDSSNEGLKRVPPAEYNENFPWPPHDSLPHAVQDVVDLLGHEITLLALVNQDPQVLFWKAAFQLVGPHAVWLPGLFLSRCRTLHFPLFHENSGLSNSPACQGPFEWQQNSLVNQQLLWVLYHLQNCWGIFCPTLQAINEDVQ